MTARAVRSYRDLLDAAAKSPTGTEAYEAVRRVRARMDADAGITHDEWIELALEAGWRMNEASVRATGA